MYFQPKIFFLFLTLLKVVKQCISGCICFFLMVINLKIVVDQLLYLLNLIKIETFYVDEIIKVIVINEDKKIIFVAI